MSHYRDSGIAVFGIESSRQDSFTEIGAFARVHGIKFPLLKDLGNKVADRFGAIRTPEVFVLDHSRTLRYWGRVDDQHGFDRGVDHQPPKPTRRDLTEALNELLEGKIVSQSPVGGTGFHIGRIRKVDLDSRATYLNQIERIIQSRCVECRREGQIALFALTEYEEVIGWYDLALPLDEAQSLIASEKDCQYGRQLAETERQRVENQGLFRRMLGG